MLNHPPKNFIIHSMRLFPFLMALLSSSFGFALSSHADADSLPQKHAVVAARLCQENNLQEALIEIERAVVTDFELSDPYTWYIRGFIYKELYKGEQNPIQGEHLREVAVQSFLKSQELSHASDQNNDAALGYLASTYFRDALNAASSLTNESDSTCFELFEAYRNIQIAIGQNDKISTGYLELLQTRSRNLLSLLSTDRCNEVLFLGVKSSYDEILSLNPTDCTALYNLAITYYNTAVFSNNSTPDAGCYDAPERESFMMNALDLLRKMEQQCDDKQNVYKALVNVLKAMNQQEEAALYESKLKNAVSSIGK